MIMAGFAEVDITPPLGTLKIGWIKRIISTEILAPLFARIAIFTQDASKVAFIQLDTLIIDETDVCMIRQNVHQRYGFPENNIMISATHNHAGPAIATAGEVPKDIQYAASVVHKITEAFGCALDSLVNVEVGFSHTYEWYIAYNRRVVMRDGTVRTHGTFDDLDALFIEGPVDPEVAVLAVRNATQQILGLLVNFACHPTHFGGDGSIHPGYPGVAAQLLKSKGIPICLFLNGASGNLHTSNPANGGKGKSAEEAGRQLAEDVLEVLPKLEYVSTIKFGHVSRAIQLPYRKVTDGEVKGTIKGAQRFIDSSIYDKTIPDLVDKCSREVNRKVEIQVVGIGNIYYVGIPAEFFVEFGLRIKQAATPKHALIVTCANGHLGYIPTLQAFQHGGYETTFGTGSMMAPEVGDIITVTAIDLLQEMEA